MSLNLDFKVQKEQKVREIEDSLQNYLPKHVEQSLQQA